MVQELRVLTLNCWGLLFVSKQRAARLRFLAEWLEKCTADLVFLQEVWVNADAVRITKQAARGRLQHAHHFVSGLFGSGLVVLSRYPIEQLETTYLEAWKGFRVTTFAYIIFLVWSSMPHRFSFWRTLQLGTLWLSSAVTFMLARAWDGHELTALGARLIASTRTQVHHTATNGKSEGQWLRYGSLDKAVHLGCTVFHGMLAEVPEVPGVRQPADKNAAVRVAQILQLSGFIHSHTPGGQHQVILAGDLNSPPESLEIQLLKQLLPELQDSWLHKPVTAPAPDLAASKVAQSASQERPVDGATANTADNSFGGTAGQGKQPIRIDYIWCGGSLRVQSSSVLADRTPAGSSFSDHNALSSVVAFTDPVPSETAATAFNPERRILRLAASTLSKGQRDMVLRGARGGLLTASDFIAALTLLGVLLSYPWWHYPKPLFVVLQVLLVATCVVLPFSFLMGWGARHAQAKALLQASAELGIWLDRWHGTESQQEAEADAHKDS